ncbi:MAG: hypothetical protein JWM80_3563 [Cyanobacteria bacterium RYN_339]|nr:hypothetical protein [Cyanobacteria bacterium RYN_339]
MPKPPVFEGRKRATQPTGRRTVFQVLTGLMILAAPTWALLATAGGPAGAVPSRPSAPAAQPGTPANSPGKAAAPAATTTTPTTSGLVGAYGAAVTLQGAVVVQDWASARRSLDALKAIKTEVPRTSLERARVNAATPLITALDASITAKNARLANEQAYILANTLMWALDARSPMASATGGGGGAAAAPAAVHPSALLEHLRQASQAAAQAQVALIGHDPKAAKADLDAVREHLKGASASTTSPRLKGTIDSLDKQRWRVVAALANPSKAYRSGTYLSRGLMRTLRLEGRRAALTAPNPAGGGGGGRMRPLLQDVPVPTHAITPRRGPSKQVALEAVPYDKRDVR